MADFHPTHTDNTSVGDSIISLWNEQTLFEAQPYLVCDQFAVKKSGSAATMYFPRFGALAAATTPLTDSEDKASVELTDTAASITATEYGLPATYNIKAQVQSNGRVDLAVTKIIGMNMGVTQDTLAVQALEAFTTTVIYPNAATAASNVTSADVLDKTFAGRLYNKLSRAAIPGAAQGMYAGIAHEDALYDLREDAGSGSWTEVSQYSNLVPVLQNEIGMFKGIRWFKSGTSTVTANSNGTIDTYKVNVLGANALGKFTNIEPKLVMSGPFDPLQRFYNIGWYGVFNYGVIDTSCMVQGIVASSVGAN